MKETADTIARVPRTGAEGQEAELWISTLKDFSEEEGCLTPFFKDTQECAGRQSGSGQVNVEAWELHGIREGHNRPRGLKDRMEAGGVLQHRGPHSLHLRAVGVRGKLPHGECAEEGPGGPSQLNS